MTDPTHVAPGWYPDPHTGHPRWWDGSQWGVYAPQQTGAVVISRSLKDVGLTYVLALLLGGFGIHNFYVGRVGVAVTQLILTIVGIATAAVGTFGMLNGIVLVWVLIELFLIPGFVRAANEAIRSGR